MAIVKTFKTQRLIISVKRGDTFDLIFSFTDEDNDPIDISGNIYVAEVKTKKESDVPVLKFTNGYGLEVIGHQILLHKSAQEMEIPAKEYFYDLQETDPYGKRKTIIEDLFIVNQDTSR